jgi:DNA-binding NarL/FixJ family response regulator
MQQTITHQNVTEAGGGRHAGFAGTPRVATVLKTALVSALELVGCESGSISLVDESRGVYVKGIDYGIGCQEGQTFALDEGVTGEVVRTRDVVILDQYAAVTGGHLSQGDPRWRLAVMGVPITWGARIVGVCVLFGTSGQVFTTSDVRAARTIAQIAGAAIASSNVAPSATIEFEPLVSRDRSFEHNLRGDEGRVSATPLVLVTVSNALIREGLMRVMESHGSFVPFDGGAHHDIEEIAASTAPEVIIVDLDAVSRQPWLSKLRLAHPESKIVAFCDRASVAQLRQAVLAGLYGVINQQSSPSRIADVIAAAARGEWIVESSSLALLITSLDGLNATQREREVLELVERGLGDKQIASSLSISVKTVEKHVHSLLQKSGAINRTMLVRMRCDPALPEGFGGRPTAEVGKPLISGRSANK